MADSLSLELSASNTTEDALPALLYTERHLANITQLLLQTSPSQTTQQQITLAAALITKTCREETQRKILADVGILEALATRLAAFVVATGCVLVYQDGLDVDAGYAHLPVTTGSSRLAPILEAIGTIVQNSKLRAIQFLSAPAFAAVFPRTEIDATAVQERKANAWKSHLFNSFANRLTPPNPLQTLLPQLPNTHYRDSTVPTPSFPPLGALTAAGKQHQSSRSFGSTVEAVQTQAYDYAEDDENPLIAWLIFVVRGESGITRLMAAWVLAIFYRFGLTSRKRETGFALLLVPLLVRMLDKESKGSSKTSRDYDSGTVRSHDWIIKEQAPAVLAMLTVDSLELQKAAFDAGAIKKLSQLLKESYDPLPPSSVASFWAPQSSSSEVIDARASVTKLGPSGLSLAAYHVTRTRESVLIALAAVASLKDEYRKAIIDNGVVPFVIDSLKPSNYTVASPSLSKPQIGETSRHQHPTIENPSAVILAACGAARGLSRSVSTLRTSLMDAGLASPLFVLLKNQDVDIQISATAVICNLVLEFSPMREVCGCFLRNSVMFDVNLT